MNKNDAQKENVILTINKQKCPQNHSCPAINVCPVNAIKQNGFKLPTVDETLCIKCGKCVKFCPMGAINFQ